MTFFGKLWRGEYTLPVAFWGFYCGGLIVCFSVSLLAYVTSTFVFYATLAFNPTPTAQVVCYVLSVAYLIVASVGVWRSAEPYWVSPEGMRRYWAGAARVVVIIWIANVARGLMDWSSGLRG